MIVTVIHWQLQVELDSELDSEVATRTRNLIRKGFKSPMEYVAIKSVRALHSRSDHVEGARDTETQAQ